MVTAEAMAAVRSATRRSSMRVKAERASRLAEPPEKARADEPPAAPGGGEKMKVSGGVTLDGLLGLAVRIGVVTETRGDERVEGE
jgi:hypothetical protein